LATSTIVVFALLASACVPEPDQAGDDQADGQATVDGVDGAGGDGSGSTATPRTTGVPTMQPTPAEDLGIALDEDGRPYDNDWGPMDDTVETRRVGVFEVPDGVLEVIDAESLYQPPLVDIRDTETVRFRTATELELSIVWQQRTVPDGESPSTEGRIDPVRWYESAAGGSTDGRYEAVLGVLLADPDATVVRWGRLQTGYNSGAGVGAFTSRSLLNWAGRNLTAEQPLVATPLTPGNPFKLVEVDDVDGPDVFVFDSGAGPGRGVLTEGFDENDQLVAVMLWDARYPWRLSVPDGRPPTQIDEREGELIDCIEGRRLVDRWGRCT
jgi:hypothetical protein